MALACFATGTTPSPVLLVCPSTPCSVDVSKPTLLLSEADVSAEAEAGSRYARRLEAYIGVLMAEGYADETTLRQSLPASICAGVLQYLLNFAKYPGQSRSYRKAVERNIKRRLSDLLDLCDLLASRERMTALEFARDYEGSGQTRRAQHLLEDYVADHPDDPEAHADLARLLRKRGKGRTGAHNLQPSPRAFAR